MFLKGPFEDYVTLLEEGMLQSHQILHRGGRESKISQKNCHEIFEWPLRQILSQFKIMDHEATTNSKQQVSNSRH